MNEAVLKKKKLAESAVVFSCHSSFDLFWCDQKEDLSEDVVLEEKEEEDEEEDEERECRQLMMHYLDLLDEDRDQVVRKRREEKKKKRKKKKRVWNGFEGWTEIFVMDQEWNYCYVFEM